MRRELIATALLGLVLTAVIGVAWPQRAEAQQVLGDQQDGNLNAGAKSPASPAAAGSSATGAGTKTGSGSGRSTCTYTKVPWELAVLMRMADALDLGLKPSDGQLAGDGSNISADGSRAYYVKCEGREARFVVLPPRATGGLPEALPTPGELAQEAASATPLPVPTVGLSPAPPILQVVNLPVFLWIDASQWAPQSASASAGGVTSTVTATPRRVMWDMGNGESVACDGPGVPWMRGVADELQPSDCRYTYPRSSARASNETFTVTTTLEWDVSWVAVGAPGGGDLGTARRSSTTPVQVSEIQVLNVPVR